DVTKWTYDPDFSHQALDDGTWQNTSLRLTLQASQRNKLNFWWDEQSICLHCNEGGETIPFPLAPEAAGRIEDNPQEMGQVTWNFAPSRDRKSTRLNSSHDQISYAVFCL